MSQCFDHNFLVRYRIEMKIYGVENLIQNATYMSEIAFS
jgi:hypothetical protein